MKINRLEISIGQYVCFVVCVLLMAIIPITRSHKIFGIDLEKNENVIETISNYENGTTVINTTEIGKKIIGYGGPTPVEITLKHGKIEKIIALPNSETPEYYGAVTNSDLLESLDGMTLDEASKAKIDGVSGATFSSTAIIQNIRTGIEYALNEEEKPSSEIYAHPLDIKFWITIAIILCGALIPLFFKNPKYRYVQLILNVAILGFWGGTFVSYSLMVSYLTNGLTSIALFPTLLLLVVAFIFPMFGKVNHYCTWLCPYGSIQDLAGSCFKKKLRVSQKTATYLGYFRRTLWFILMWLLWTGLWFDWMGYEPFAAFFFQEAAPATLIIAGIFLALSFFIPRPYCRFVCPTGTLFKLSEGRK